MADQEDKRKDGLKLSMLMQPPASRPWERPADPGSPQRPRLPSPPYGPQRPPVNYIDEEGPPIGASVLDGFFVFCLGFVLFIVAIVVVPRIEISRDPGLSADLFILFPMAMSVAGLSYSVLLYLMFGRTIGKRIMGTVVLRRGGSPASHFRCALRPVVRWGPIIVAQMSLLAFLYALELFNLGGSPPANVARVFIVLMYPIILVWFTFTAISGLDDDRSIIDFATDTELVRG